MELCMRTIEIFKKVLQQRQEIESHLDLFKLSLENESQYCGEDADCLDNLDSSHEM